MKKNILITGGTGLVGARLSEKLIAKGYTVSLLSRTAGEGAIKKYRWDLKTGYIEEEAIRTADYIIHLAGAGVFDKRWSAEYKKEIMDSRIVSSALLCKALSSIPNTVKAFISTSAIGIYGSDTGAAMQTEVTTSGTGFLAEVTRNWEAAITPIEALGIRTAIIRIGIVFSAKGGALAELAKPIQYFIGSPMGKGDQYMSWIHIDDLCDLYCYAIENEKIAGVYNAVAPEPMTNKAVTIEIAAALKKPLWLPNIPAVVMKLVVGFERAAILLGGNRVSADKIIGMGFKFNYPHLKEAIRSLLKNDK